MVSISNIAGNTAYWGRHTFEATTYGTGVQITVYRNCPRKYETSYIFSSVEDLVQLSQDKSCAFYLYAGELSGKRLVDKEWVETIDYFLSCFKHKTKKVA